jgi:hypothetical protein
MYVCTSSFIDCVALNGVMAKWWIGKYVGERYYVLFLPANPPLDLTEENHSKPQLVSELRFELRASSL